MQPAACSERLEHQSANAPTTKIVSLQKPYRPASEPALTCGLSDDDQTVRLDRPNSSTFFNKIEELPKKLHRPGRSASQESDNLDERQQTSRRRNTTRQKDGSRTASGAALTIVFTSNFASAELNPIKRASKSSTTS